MTDGQVVLRGAIPRQVVTPGGGTSTVFPSVNIKPVTDMTSVGTSFRRVEGTVRLEANARAFYGSPRLTRGAGTRSH